MSRRLDSILMIVMSSFIAVVLLWSLVFEDGNSVPEPRQVPSRELPAGPGW